MASCSVRLEFDVARTLIAGRDPVRAVGDALGGRRMEPALLRVPRAVLRHELAD